MTKKLKTRNPRRLLTATVSAALLISLSSCSAAGNSKGNISPKDVYAQVGDYSLTNGELWNELKWSASSVITDQVTTVVLDEEIKLIKDVVANDYSKLSDDQKKKLNISSAEEFTTVYNKFKNRLIDYVVQDVYALVYEKETYWEKLEDISKLTKDLSVEKFINNAYNDYHIEKIGDEYIRDIISNSDENNPDGFFKIAVGLSEKFYPLYAKELAAYYAVVADADKADKEDDDLDDSNEGYFTTNDYTSMFKTEYTCTYDVNLVFIKFTSSNEFKDTLRAFGIKLDNKKYYLIKDNADDDYDTYNSGSDRISYEEYVKYYDDFKVSNLNKQHGVEELNGEVLLEIYAYLYNYMYASYRTPLEVIHDYSISDLNNLRQITYNLINDYSEDPQGEYEKMQQSLITNNKEDVTFNADKLRKHSDTLRAQIYETLKDDDVNSAYTTSLQSGNVVAFKFGNNKSDIEDAKIKAYEEFYTPDKTTLEILEFIRDEEKNPGLKAALREKLITDQLSQTTIDNRVDERIDDVKVKVYNEAVELSYANSHSDYSKAVKPLKDKNILATITYKKKTYNLDIKAKDAADANKKTILIPGTDTPFGVYDYLESTVGATTAIDLISKKIIKDTKAYQDVKKDKETKDIYENYLNVMLANFAYNGYASSGYPSTIGKYNFLMLYFHTADVKSIINDYYLVQHISNRLLTKYNDNDELVEFFKIYSDLAYEDYFSLSGSRLVVYMDADDDDEIDDVDVNDPTNWINKEVNFDGAYVSGTNVKMSLVAKDLVYEVYNKLMATSTSHTEKLDTLVSEINGSARVQYSTNPIVVENTWAKYRKLGLKVKIETFSTTNADLSIDFTLKQRVYDYARGQNSDGTKTYEYFKGQTTPTAYIEPLTKDDVSDTNDNIIITKDGVNLILVTEGVPKATAEFKAEDNDDKFYDSITVKYGEGKNEYTTITGIYNTDADNKKLNAGQIQLYIVDNSINGSSVLSPSALADSYKAYLSGAFERYRSAETQRIILLYFIKQRTNSTKDVYDLIEFKNADYNGTDGYLAKMIKINQIIADNYSTIYNDTTGTSNQYPDWWTKLEEQVEKFLIKEEA